MQQDDEAKFLTDAELAARWKCSKMKIWRMRRDGRLPQPIKLGSKSERGHNLTRLADIQALEAA